MIWSISQFPELDHLDPSERAVALRRVPWWTYPRLVFGAVVVGIMVGGWILLLANIQGVGGWAAWMSGAVAAVVVSVLAYLGGIRQIRKTVRKELIERFRGLRPPFCLSCGYDLRASTSDTCTECGRWTLSVPTILDRLARRVGRFVGSWFGKR